MIRKMKTQVAYWLYRWTHPVCPECGGTGWVPVDGDVPALCPVVRVV